MAKSTIDRRHFLIGAAALPLFTIRSRLTRAAQAAPGAGEFWQGSCEHNTAEEVTAGLDLRGKTALITGCNAGVGYETLRVLVLRGAHVYGVARTLEKAEMACGAVTRDGVKGTATPLACEQTDFSSVVACADAVRGASAPIDMLICNAGIYGVRTLELAQGVEKQFAVNHLSHFILVNRLLAQVKAARQGRIVVVASGMTPFESSASEPGIDFESLSGRHYDPGKMYRQSKIANEMFVRELAKRLSRTHATANVLSPGLVKTEHAVRYFQSDHNVDLEKVPMAKTVEQGAATTCYVATNPALDHVTGVYFYECNQISSKENSTNDALAKKLWTVSEQLTRPYLSHTSG